MKDVCDGPASPLFRTTRFRGNASLARLRRGLVSERMQSALEHAPTGRCVFHGIPFHVGSPLLASDRPVSVRLPDLTGNWLVFVHTTDVLELPADERGFIQASRGHGRLGDQAATYVIRYADGVEEEVAIRCRYEIGMFQRPWGENCVCAVAHLKPRPLRPPHEQPPDAVVAPWGRAQTRVSSQDMGPWIDWLWAWENPRPDVPIVRLRVAPGGVRLLLWGVAVGNVRSNPLRWRRRRKALLTLPDGVAFDPRLDRNGCLRQIRLDLGQVISALPRPLYPDSRWTETPCNFVPDISERQILVEYTSHGDACFHLDNGEVLPVRDLERRRRLGPLRVVPPAHQRVQLRIADRESGVLVPAKLHVHGSFGEYLAPVDRHRIPNPAWFEDYSVDFTHRGIHHSTYVPGEAILDLPRGNVFVEVTRGFEVRPVRRTFRVDAATREITIYLDKVLHWREKGWVSADTHVHFLSPPSALFEGKAEDVNVVNLLASQWGELMTNVGDFDGRTTYGAKEFGGDGEYLLRVGTENRQHILGHISLLGYNGNIIAPMTTGGPDESALGDAVECLLSEWAEQCRRQGGIVVLPHFPNPRLEGAAAILRGLVDGVEMTSWGNLYAGIDPYSLSDWYRYLNCGYFVAAVGGTDKMTAATAVGTVRTYARLADGEPFSYEAWKAAVRAGRTFVTYGPLMEFSVEGRPPGSRISMTSTGGSVDVTWQVASVTIPITQVELVVNGEIRESTAIPAGGASGSWRVAIDKSSWLALLVRGQYPGMPEVIAAHSSPVMIDVAGSEFMSAADALTILEQVEGALAFLDALGTRAETAAWRRMRLLLTSTARELHNRMHRRGIWHRHTAGRDHPEHHRERG